MSDSREVPTSEAPTPASYAVRSIPTNRSIPSGYHYGYSSRGYGEPYAMTSGTYYPSRRSFQSEFVESGLFQSQFPGYEEVINVRDQPSFFKPGRYMEPRLDGREDLPPMEVIVHPPADLPPPRVLEISTRSHPAPLAIPSAQYMESRVPVTQYVETRERQVPVPMNVEIEYRETIRYPDGRVDRRPPTFDYISKELFLSEHPDIMSKAEWSQPNISYGAYPENNSTFPAYNRSIPPRMRTFRESWNEENKSPVGEAAP